VASPAFATYGDPVARLFLLFTLVPLFELFLLLRIADHVGGGTTFALVLVTGALGAWLAKREGLRVLRDWQGALRNGQVPETGVVQGLLVLVGGVLLVTPGVVTDLVGLSLLLPFTRAAIARSVVARVERAVREGRIQVTHVSYGAPRDRSYRPTPRQVIDVEPVD